MLKTALLLCLCSCFAMGQTALAQSGEVTFYSHSSLTKTLLLPYTKDAIFSGWLYDGEQKLGWVSYNQFFTLNLPPGPHHFSATHSGKHPDTKHDLLLQVTAGEHYFISLSYIMANYLAVETLQGRMEEVDCATAQASAARAKPAKSKYVPKEVRPELISSGTFPGCSP